MAIMARDSSDLGDHDICVYCTIDLRKVGTRPGLSDSDRRTWCLYSTAALPQN